jgi:hypothetical protein
LNFRNILRETLHFYPSTQPALIFNRYFNEENQTSIVEYGKKLKISEQAKEAIVLKTLKNTSVLAAFKQVNIDLPEMEVVYRWFNDQFNPMIDPYMDLTYFSNSNIKNDDELRAKVVDFFKRADINISNISVVDDIKEIDEEILKFVNAFPISDERKNKIFNEKAIHFDKTVFEHRILKNNIEEFHKLDQEFQSQGTLRYYGLSTPFFYTIKNDAFLPIDEIGSALHPLLVMHFLREFLNKSKQSQLLFTTHNMSLLMEKDLLRKDAIWFTEKENDGTTSLFSLSDFNIRKELSFFNAYKQGKFGAIPKLED